MSENLNLLKRVAALNEEMRQALYDAAAKQRADRELIEKQVASLNARPSERRDEMGEEHW